MGAVVHPKLVLSVHVSWLGFLGIHCIFIYVELFAFRITWMGNLQSGCKKWFGNLFSGLPFFQQLVSNSTSGTKASIILIACYCLARHKFVSFSFPFSCGFFLLPPPPPHPCFWSTILKSQKYLPKPDTFYSQQAFNTEIFGIAYLISNLSIAEMLGWFFLFPIQVT